MSLLEEEIKTQRQMHTKERCEDTGEPASTSQGMPKATISEEGSLEQILPCSPQKKPPCPHLDFRLLHSRAETMNFCSKSPSLQDFVKAALED